MENEFKIRQDISSAVAFTSTGRTQNSRDLRTMRNDYRTELESVDSSYSVTDTSSVGYPKQTEQFDYQRRAELEMKDYLETLTTQAENITNSTEQFNMDLETCMEQMEESAQKLLENTEKQAGRMSEQFSQALSQEKLRLRKHTTKLILFSMIPSVLLIAWELIRHFFLET